MYSVQIGQGLNRRSKIHGNREYHSVQDESLASGNLIKVLPSSLSNEKYSHLIKILGDECCRQNQNLENNEIVCSKCNKILSPAYYSNGITDFNIMSEIKEFLDELCHRCHIPSNVSDFAYHRYSTFAEINTQTRYTPKEVAGYALYVTLNIMGCSRTPLELEAFSGIPRTKIWKMERENCFLYHIPQIKDLAERYCAQLGLPYLISNIIQDICCNISGMEDLKPNNTVALIIYFFCKDKDYNICLVDICQVCNCSLEYMKRLTKRFHKCISENLHIYLE
jgi:hypothetical protein